MTAHDLSPLAQFLAVLSIAVLALILAAADAHVARRQRLDVVERIGRRS